MTTVVQEDFRTTYSFWLWPLLTVLPLIIAAGMLENPEGRQGPLGEGAYRSLLSDSPLGSSLWRAPQQDQNRWRETPPPPVGWRAAPQPLPENGSSNRPLELFPRYTPGKTSDYDFISREEKPLIKVFDFGSK
jgi:hypothetical protein